MVALDDLEYAETEEGFDRISGAEVIDLHRARPPIEQ